MRRYRSNHHALDHHNAPASSPVTLIIFGVRAVLPRSINRWEKVLTAAVKLEMLVGDGRLRKRATESGQIFWEICAFGFVWRNSRYLKLRCNQIWSCLSDNWV